MRLVLLLWNAKMASCKTSNAPVHLPCHTNALIQHWMSNESQENAVKWVGHVKWARQSRTGMFFITVKRNNNLWLVSCKEIANQGLLFFFFVSVMVAVITIENWTCHKYNSFFATGLGQGPFFSKLIDGLLNDGISGRLSPVLLQNCICNSYVETENYISEKMKRENERETHTHIHCIRLGCALKKGIDANVWKVCVAID